jgi:predicted alpha/beta hydrolase family esterase
VAASENDPLCGMERAEALARDWGSAVVNIGPAGHLNPAAGFGPWPRAHEFIAALS